ncbi:cache domain-containing sensor histidine kinase [Paenibacillus sp. S-38]|uniref:cache domain-containing sensor histidine kinase n=1 Tax=Paenibacillus sp. S-38 TaxID=3416710 RepID=UPI003CE75A6C
MTWTIARRIGRTVSGRLRNKLVLSFSLIAAFIVILLSYTSYRQSVDTGREHYIASNMKLLRLVNQNLDSYLAQIDELSLSPHRDSRFMDELHSDAYLSRFYIQNQVKNWFYSRDDMEELTVYTPGTEQEYTISRSAPALQQRTDDRTEAAVWYREAVGSPKYRSLEPAGGGEDRQSQGRLLTFHRIIIDIADKTPLAAVSITLNRRQFDPIVHDLFDDKGEAVVLLDERDRLVYSSGGGLTEERLAGLRGLVRPGGSGVQMTGGTEGQGELLLYHISDRYHWKLLKVTSMEVLNREAAHARNINLAFGSAFVLLAVLVTVLTANAITGRLKQLHHHIGRLGEGDFEPSLEIRGTDEVAHLSRKFNQMAVKINDLIADRYVLLLNERNAKLRALEAQINPHFLYNSLQAISTEAILSGVEPIQEMVDALAASLRYCIRDSEKVLLTDELEHIRNYLVLQRARFGDRLQVEERVGEEALGCPIPRMTLQILLENAVEHALEQMIGEIHITITAVVRSGRLMLQVEDDGPGITADRLTELSGRFAEGDWADGESLGLKNLHSRLRLLFGEDVVLDIRSEAGQGTTVEIGMSAGREPVDV